MNIALHTPTHADMLEYNENSEAPYFAAQSCVLDQGGVELSLGGVTIGGVFERGAEFDNAWALVSDVYVERPNRREAIRAEGRVSLMFYTGEQLADDYSYEELEFKAFAALEAIQIKQAQEAAEAICELTEGIYCSDGLEAVLAPKAGRVTFLEPVGLMSKEEVAARFSLYNGKSA